MELEELEFASSCSKTTRNLALLLLTLLLKEVTRAASTRHQLLFVGVMQKVTHVAQRRATVVSANLRFGLREE